MFEIDDVTAYIATLSITGQLPNGQSKPVTIYDYNGIANSADSRACPILQPDVTARIVSEPLERNSQGGGGVAMQTLDYTLPYVLLYQPIGAERGLYVVLPGLIQTLKAILTAVTQNDFITGTVVVKVRVKSFEFGGTVSDPTGGTDGRPNFHGARINLDVRELIN